MMMKFNTIGGLFFSLCLFPTGGLFAQGVNTIHESSMRPLEGEWQFSQSGMQVWRDAQVPGTVHTDLLRAGLIPDPYYRLNERFVQWVDKSDWEYRTPFVLSEEEVSAPQLKMLFEGLDTYADVYVNGRLMLEADNMFREWEVDIKRVAQAGENELKIYFHSPITKGKELLNQYGLELPASNDQSLNGGLCEHERVSVYERKAPYHFGWDWGPRLVTSGVWKPIYIVAQQGARIEDAFFIQNKVTQRRADVTVALAVDASTPQKDAIVELYDVDTKKVIAHKQVDLSKGDNEVSVDFSVKNPELWWSNGLGEPHLYQWQVRLRVGDEVQSVWDEAIGLRSLRLVEEPDPAGGMSLYFELNGVPVFTKGANHIPNDLFVDRMTREVYENEIKNAADANMNMLRVWGGGIYENDYFYDLCDQHGILVWQDFMFACSMYPASEDFYQSVVEEAKDNVKRLRNHACLALWCGNNEIDIAWSNYNKYGGWGWKNQYTPAQRQEIWGAYERIFKEILADAVAEYDPMRSYRHSSPMTHTPETHSNYGMLDEGDIHYWDVWHGRKPIEDAHNVLGRYMSEYGFQSFPEMNTIEQYAEVADYSIDSEVMSAHQRSPIGNAAILEYMRMYYQVPNNFEDFIYLQQQLQSDAMVIAIEAHRQNMPHTMGSLYWQINDCWPVASWSSTDYYRRWKALHYGVKRAFAPLILTAKEDSGRLVLSVVNDALKPISGVNYQIQVMDCAGNVSKAWQQKGRIAANAVTPVLEKSMQSLFENPNQFIQVVASNKDGELASCVYYPTKVKEMQIPQVTPSFSVTQVNDHQVEVEIMSPTLAKSLWIDFESTPGFFSDNYFDVLPNQNRRVSFTSEEPVDAEALQKKLHYKHVSSLSYDL